MSQQELPLNKGLDNVPIARHIAELHPEEYESLLAIKGWRMWECPGATSLLGEEYEEALRSAESKAQALYVSRMVDGRMYNAIGTKYEELTGRSILGSAISGVFDGEVVLLLEPLNEVEVRMIDELGEAPGPAGSIDRPHEIIRPEYLQEILQLRG